MFTTAFIGTGGIANAHAKALQKLGVRITGCYDKCYEAAYEFATMYGTTAYNNPWDAMKDADIVHLCTPPGKRIEYLEMAMKAGKHIFSEKPIAASLEDGEKFVEMEKKYGVRTAVSFVHSYRDPFMDFQKKIRSGMCGKINTVYCYRGSMIGQTGGQRAKSWRTEPGLVCGMTIESVSHEIDMLLQLEMKPVCVRAATVFASKIELPEFDDNVEVIFDLEQGGTYILHASWGNYIPYGMRGVIGDRGAVAMKGTDAFDFDEIRWRTADSRQQNAVYYNQPYSYEIEAFVRVNQMLIDAIEQNTTCKVDAAYGLKVLQISHKLFEAARTKRAIRLADI